MVGMPAPRFTAAANGTWKPSVRLIGSAVDRPVRPPDDVSTTSMPSAFSSLRIGDRVVDVPAAAAVDRRDADEHRLVLRPVLAHRLGRGEREAHAAGAVAAILVVALVADRREELRQQVAVRAVDLDDVVARGIGAARGLAELLHDQRLDLRDGELRAASRSSARPPTAPTVRRPASAASRRPSGRTRPACRTGAASERLAAGMGDLRRGQRRLPASGSASAACGPRSGCRPTCRDRPA